MVRPFFVSARHGYAPSPLYELRLQSISTIGMSFIPRQRGQGRRGTKAKSSLSDVEIHIQYYGELVWGRQPKCNKRIWRQDKHEPLQPSSPACRIVMHAMTENNYEQIVVNFD